MNNSMLKRLLAMFLAVVMVIGYVPVSAFATETELEGAASGIAAEVEETAGNTESQEATEAPAVETTESPAEETTEAPTEEATEAAEEETEAPTEEATEAPTEAEPVPYTVNYAKWDWDLEDFVLLETEVLAGMAGELTNVPAKDFDGLILMDEIQQVEIAADGSTVVEVYYVELLEEATAYGDMPLYDTSVSNGYFNVVEQKVYDLAPGAQEYGFTLNNASGTDRKLVHVFAVDTKNEDIQVMPGYYGIDKLDPNNLALDGVVDKKEFWQAKELTKTVAYYENMGYNVVGAMNTALAYDSDAPYGYMVWNGVVLGTPEVHKGAQTYLAIDWEGNCELRSMSTPLTGNEQTAISANFGWLVKDGTLTSTSVERNSSDASRSMIGIKADGTLIFCHVDGRQGDAVSGGLSNYEMGEMMLALGCVNAVNCDGGGSSTFVSKRSTDTANIMRSMPSDGAERPTINSVILVSTAGASGIFDQVLFESEYEYIAPGASMAFDVIGKDTKQFTMDIPAEVTYQVAEEGMGTVANGIYTAGNATGIATIQAVYNGAVVGEKVLNIVHPDSFGFTAADTVLPYGKSMDLIVVGNYGADNWDVCIDGAYTLSLSDSNAAVLDGIKLTATSDESIKGVNVTATYTPDAAKTSLLKVEYGKGSEIVFNFEDGDVSNFMGIDEMLAWAKEVGAPAKITADGNFSENTDAQTFLATADNGQVKNGDYALGVTLDYTEASFASWSYNMFFYTGEQIVLRDVANGMNATTLGMWVYIPEGAAGLAMQIQGTKVRGDVTSGTGAHFYFTTVSGAKKNLNSCTEADIPSSRWVYATVDLTSFGDYFATYDPMAGNSRSPSFIRFYVKPTKAENLTFYFDDFTLDYSSAVDDRILPTISGIEYATGDTAAALENGATITSGSAAFSATVEDQGAAGLNIKSAQIFLDGNPVDTQVSGKKMATASDLVLSKGPHTVTFEISDNLGNFAQVSRTFTVKTSEETENGVVYLTGHNDSGEMPEIDSVYYVDIKTTDAAAVNYVEANIQLNTANKWELEHMIVAPGYEVEYIQLDAGRDFVTYAANSDIHSVENVVAITLTRTDDCTLTGEQTLLSIPVRLWSWDGIDHVTGKPITPEEQFKTGYCPVVNVTASVLFGYAETTNGDVTFGGGIDVATKINDTVYPWHYHDAELTVLNQAASCTVDGYENRTYCETCKSVIDWGTKLEATGHTYEFVDAQLVCGCGKTITGNGLVTVNDKIYVLIADKLVTGWQNVDGKDYYFDPATYTAVDGGHKIGGYNYVFENHVLVEGSIVRSADGKCYYMWAGQWKTAGRFNVGEKTYWIKPNRELCVGRVCFAVTTNSPLLIMDFDENGVLLDEHLNGIFEFDGQYYYVIDSEVQVGSGAIEVGEDIYYIRSSSVAATGKYFVAPDKTNGILEQGYYLFGADGKLVKDAWSTEWDGTERHIVNGRPAEVKYGLVVIGGDIYYIRSNGQKATGRYYVGESKLNGILERADDYVFDNDGKLIKEGWSTAWDGTEKYIVNGKPAKLTYGLMVVQGEIYYIRSNSQKATGRYYVGENRLNGILERADDYVFDGDGKFVKEGWSTAWDGTEKYILNGKPAKPPYGLIIVQGEIYYIRSNGQKATGEYYVGENRLNGILKESGVYLFDEDGKLILE